MFDQFLSKAAELLGKGEPFAVAIVVNYEAPISGKPGYKAIIRADGHVWGWVGGGCTQPLIVQEALKALGDGRPRLVRISPTGELAETTVTHGLAVNYPMTCHSGGAVEIYIEPVFSKPQIVLLGRSPIAENLARLGKAINYAVYVAAPGADREAFFAVDEVRESFDLSSVRISRQTYVVVSTQGEGDEEALAEALKTDAPYIAFVASKKKAARVFDSLRASGVPAQQLKKLRVPAGLKINATTPEEIAVSILAEIIQLRGESAEPLATIPDFTISSAPSADSRGIDPICGMTVQTASAKHKSEYEGKTLYFCGAGCKQKFDAEPARYTLAAQLHK